MSGHNSSDFCDEEVTEVGNKILWACIAALLYHDLYTNWKTIKLFKLAWW